MTRHQTDGVIDEVEVEITTRGGDEHLAELIHSDLTGRAEELNQIVELGTHPDATSRPTRIDWEGWLHGNYEGVKEPADDP